MKLKFRAKYLVGIFAAIALLLLDFNMFFSFRSPVGPTGRWFYPLLILSLTIAWAQFWMDFLKERKRQKRIEEKFLDFVRDLTSTAKSGIPIPKAIIQSATKDYSELNPYLKKLANQISAGIPVRRAFETFTRDTGNATIKRAMTIVMEAEASGGNIEDVLSSVTESLVSVRKLQEERKSSIFSQIIQGYIVYFVFIAIMLILQLKLFPKLGEMGSKLSGSGMQLLGKTVTAAGTANLDTIFFMLLMIQGLFAGIMIGKFSEGTVKDGFIHSVVLMTIAALVVTTAKGGI